MDYFIDDQTDLSNIAMYNLRDADLHVQVAKKLGMCEKILMAASCARCPVQDSVANNTGVMTFCMMGSFALTTNRKLNPARKTASSSGAGTA